MSEHVCANIIIRDNGSPHNKGWKMEGHTHNFPHVTYIVRGKYRCKCWARILNSDGTPMLNGKGEEMWMLKFDVVRQGPCYFPVEAEHKHSFESYEDGGILHCLFPARDPVTKEISEWNGWLDASH